MNNELKLINAVCKNKDLATVLSEDATPLFTTYRDAFDWIVDYWRKYRSTPDIEVVKENFDFIENVEIKGETQYYLNELRNDYASSKLQANMLEWARSLDAGTSGLEVLEKMNQEVTKLARISSVVKDVDLANEVEERIQHMQDIAQKNKDGMGVTGIASNVNAIDTSFSGFQPGDLIVLMGWTGSAKSWFALYLACQAWSQGYKPLYFSLEMGPRLIGPRVDTLLGAGEFSNVKLMNGLVDFDNFRSWAKNTYNEQHGFIVVSSEGLDTVTPNTVAAKIEQHKPDIIFLDYQQLFDDDNGARNETERNKNISKAFKRIAVKYDIPVVNITAVTMETGQQGTRPPFLEEVAWSRQIAYDADLVIALHKTDHLFQGVSRKVRRGEHFAFNYQWDIDRGILKEFYDHTE